MRFPERKSAALILAASVVFAGAAGGCPIGSGGFDVSHIRFSPDGRTVAFVGQDGWGVCAWALVDVVGVTFGRKRLSWGSGVAAEDTAPRWRRAHVDMDCVMHSASLTNGGAWSYGCDEIQGLEFSPDSRRVAMDTERKLIVIDLAAGRCHRPIWGDHRVRGPAWLSAEELVWWETGRVGLSPTHQFSVYRQKVADLWSRRRLVCRARHTSGPTLAVWSPGARYLVFAPGSGEQCRLLDVDRQKLLAIGPRRGDVTGVAWKKDGSAVLCAIRRPDVGSKPGPSGEGPPVVNEFFLVDPAAGTTQRWAPGQDDRSAGRLRYRLSGRWTADGRYVVANTYRGAFLLDPTARTIRPVVWRSSGDTDSALPEELEDFAPLPVAGWLQASCSLRTYAVDYAGRRVVKIEDRWPRAISPRGDRIAGKSEVGERGEVVVRPLRLPSLGAEGAEPQPADGAARQRGPVRRKPRPQG